VKDDISSHERLVRLARIERAAAPVASVYLNTRWVDEHQRDRMRIARLIAGVVSGSRHETSSDIARRASELVSHVDMQEQGSALAAVLTEAAKGGRAVAGVDATVEAVNRGAVRRLYVLKTLSLAGWSCARCASLQGDPGIRCRLCGGEATPVELTNAIVDRVIASGGEAEIVDVHEDLRRLGGLAALLRYPL